MSCKQHHCHDQHHEAHQQRGRRRRRRRRRPPGPSPVGLRPSCQGRAPCISEAGELPSTLQCRVSPRLRFKRRSISIATHSPLFYVSTPRDPPPPHYNTNPRQDKGTAAGALPGLLFSIIIEDRVERRAAQFAMESIDRSLGSGLVPDWFRLRSGVVAQRNHGRLRAGIQLGSCLVPVGSGLVPASRRRRC